MNIRLAVIATCIALFTASCSSVQNIPYFQDTANEHEVALASQEAQTIRVQTGDKLSIIVNCRQPELTQLFNLPYTTRRLGQTSSSSSSYDQGVSGYSVDSKGEIDFPVLGKIKVAGMTRSEITLHIKTLLEESEQASDAIVTVEFMNLRIYVLGEVKTPGKHSIDNDVMTVIDAISMSGDLTIYGRRDNVQVKRVIDGKEYTYTIDLTNTESMLASPGYYLQQNDVIYVEPNKVRARQSTVNGNNVLSTSFWISVANLAITVAVLIF